MLESDYQRELEAHTAGAQRLVVLPDEWTTLQQQRGIVPSRYDERRRFARKYFPIPAVLEVPQTIPTVLREPGFYVVFTTDISRGGVSFFHHAQLFPGERPVLWLTAGKYACSVARCVKRNDQCFEIGARFAVD